MVEVVDAYVKDLIGRRKKETPDQLDEYVEQSQQPQEVEAE